MRNQHILEQGRHRALRAGSKTSLMLSQLDFDFKGIVCFKYNEIIQCFGHFFLYCTRYISVESEIKIQLISFHVKSFRMHLNNLYFIFVLSV